MRVFGKGVALLLCMARLVWSKTSWFQGMSETYSEKQPMTFQYLQIFVDAKSVEQQMNCSCVTAVFYFQANKIIYHFYGASRDKKQSVLYQNGVMIPKPDEENNDKDCYIMLRNHANNSNVLTMCVLDWEIDQSVLITASGTNRSFSAMTNHLVNTPLLHDRIVALPWKEPLYSTIQKECPFRNPAGPPS